MLRAVFVCPICERQAEGEGLSLPPGWIHVKGEGHVAIGALGRNEPNFAIEGVFDRNQCLQRWVDSLVAAALDMGLNPD